MNRFGADYDYFFILDSDSRASLNRPLSIASTWHPRIENLAVIQTKTLTMTSASTRLTRSAGDCPARVYGNRAEGDEKSWIESLLWT